MEGSPVSGASNKNAHPVLCQAEEGKGPTNSLFSEKFLAPKELQALSFQKGGGLEGQAGQLACFSAAWYLLHLPTLETALQRVCPKEGPSWGVHLPSAS